MPTSKTALIHESQKLLNRVPCIRRLSACRGGINNLLAEVLEDHVREHLMGSKDAGGRVQRKAADALIDIVHAYFK